MSDSDGENLLELRNKLKMPPASTAQQRHAADLKAIKATRGAGVIAREEQINFKVPKGTKARFKTLAMNADLSMVAAFERAMALLEAEIQKGRKS